MAIILTTIDGQIITWARQPWHTPGEYTNARFRVVVCDVPTGQHPVEITDLGPEGYADFDTWDGTVGCPRTHMMATVRCEADDGEGA